MISWVVSEWGFGEVLCNALLFVPRTDAFDIDCRTVRYPRRVDQVGSKLLYKSSSILA